MRRRKFLALAGAAVIAVGLAACGEKAADSQSVDSAVKDGNKDDSAAADEDVYKVDIEEEGTKVKITCKRGGTKVEQSLSSYNYETMNKVAAQYAEAFGKSADEVAGKNWEKIEYEVTISKKIIYGEEGEDSIKIYVPDTTEIENVRIRLIAEDESTVEFDMPAQIGATTDAFRTILGSRCVFVGYQ